MLPKLLVQHNTLSTRAVLLDDHGVLRRFSYNIADTQTPIVGDVYCVRAVAPMSGGNGWFVGLLDNSSAMIRNPGNDIAVGDKILAQVSRITDKGYSMARHIRLYGRYISLTYNTSARLFSQNIEDDAIAPEAIANETQALHARLDQFMEAYPRAKPPLCLYSANDVISKLLQLAPLHCDIHVDDPHLAQQLQTHIDHAYPDLQGRVYPHPAFRDLLGEHGADCVYEELCAPHRSLSCGGRIHIDATHAATCFDIDQADSHHVSKTNRNALQEIARIIALREYGGVMIIDPIHQEQRGYLLRLLQNMSDACITFNVPLKALHIT
ncbi:MAG: ribonuclease E/G, partial [Pseudomonadota bacterium]